MPAATQEKWKTRDLRVALYSTGSCERNLRQLAARLGLHRVEYRGVALVPVDPVGQFCELLIGME